MNKKKLTDILGTKNFWRKALVLALPIALQNMLTSSFTLVDTLLVDVQPVNKLLDQEDYGIDGDIKYRIFSDLNEHILDGSYVEYRGSMYRVLSIIEWDDYVEFFVGNLND